MQVVTFDIDGLVLLTPKRHYDGRGFFSEVFRYDCIRELIGDVSFVQENVSRSVSSGTIRGLHYQAPPRAQGKLVRASRGRILDVAVDVRPGSPTYGRWLAVELSDDNWSQLWIPPGFLHGFKTLTDEVEVSYKVTDYYSAAHDGAVAFDDPDIGVDWGIGRADVQLSDKDLNAPSLASWVNPFSPN